MLTENRRDQEMKRLKNKFENVIRDFVVYMTTDESLEMQDDDIDDMQNILESAISEIGIEHKLLIREIIKPECFKKRICKYLKRNTRI